MDHLKWYDLLFICLPWPTRIHQSDFYSMQFLLAQSYSEAVIQTELFARRYIVPQRRARARVSIPFGHYHETKCLP